MAKKATKKTAAARPRRKITGASYNRVKGYVKSHGYILPHGYEVRHMVVKTKPKKSR